MSADSNDNAPVPSNSGTQWEQKELFPNLIKVERERIEIEKARIESSNRKTEVINRAIDASDASDKRQYDFHMARLTHEREDKMQRYVLARNVVYVGGGVLLLFLVALFCLMFVGSESQRNLALEAWKVLFIGASGYGIISAVALPLRKLFNGFSGGK